MGRLKRASSKKEKKTTIRPSLTNQILGKKAKKVKKAKVSKVEDHEEKDVKAERKLAKKIVKLSKISEKEVLDQEEHRPEGENKSIRKMVSMMKSVQVEDKYADILDKDGKYYDKFIENEFQGDFMSELERNDEKLSLARIKHQPIMCLRNTDIGPEIYELYEGVGVLLSEYRKGRLPKALRAVHLIRFYKDLLQIMRPNNWSAAAIFQVTRHFVACAKPNACYEYFKDILLPRVRDDIIEYGRLNYYIFNALCKATHKPAVFFTGIVFSLCENNCTAKEAVVLSAVISRGHFPGVHVAAAIIKISQLPYSVVNCIFLRFLLQKRCMLPLMALDRLMEYFIGFESSSIEPSVSWHHILLLFVQNYRNYFNPEKTAQIISLIKVKKHYAISPAVVAALKEQATPSQIVQKV